MTSPGTQKDSLCTNYTERNFPLNVQSFVPFALSQQQLYLQRQQQQQQHQQQHQQQQQQDQHLRAAAVANKYRLSQLNLARELSHQQSLNDFNSNNDDDDQSPTLTLDPNIYATKKTVMTILCLIIIIMANSIQLKFVIKNSALIHHQFYNAQVGLGVTSVLLAAFIGIFLMYVAILDFNDPHKHKKLELLNNLVIILLFVLIVFNIFLVAFYG